MTTEEMIAEVERLSKTKKITTKQMPTKKKKKKNQENILGTAGAILTDVGTGFLKTSEDMADALQYGAANVAGLVGANGAKDWLINNAQFDSTKAVTGTAQAYYDPYTYNGFKNGQLGEMVSQGVGQLGAQIGATGLLPTKMQYLNVGKTPLLNKVPLLNKMALPTTSLLQGYGSGITTGLERGKTFEESQAYGLLNAGLQAGSEAISGGIGGVIGKGAIDDVVIETVTKKVKSNVGKFLTELGIKAIGEGLEENIAGLIDPYIQRMTIDPNAKDYFTDENGKFTLSKAGQDFLVGALTSAIGQSPSTLKSIATKQTYIPISQRENDIPQKVQVTENKTYTAPNIAPSVNTKEEVKTSVETPKIEPQTQINEQYVDRNEQIQNEELDKLNNIVDNTPKNELLNKLKQFYLKNEELDKTLTEQKYKKDGSYTQEGLDLFTVRDFNRLVLSDLITKNGDYENSVLKEINDSIELDKTNNAQQTEIKLPTQTPLTNEQKIYNFRQTASQYWKNTKESQALASVVEKVISEKGYNVILDPTIKNGDGNEVNAQIKTINEKTGEIEIRINPNSKRAGEFLLTHEITHAIQTDEMKNLILDYAKKNTGFNQALEILKQTYQTEDVSPEVVADISGQLLGNQEFLNNLSMENPGTFKTMYNAIISWLNKLTGNSNERLFLLDLKNKFETAYRTQQNNLNGVNYAYNQNNEQEFEVKNSKGEIVSNYDSNGRKLPKAVVEFFKDSVVRDEQGRLLVMYHGTSEEFYAFDTGKIKIDNLGKGFYFIDNVVVAKSYAKRRTTERGGKERVIDVYLNVKKPFILENVSRETALDYLEYYFNDKSKAEELANEIGKVAAEERLQRAEDKGRIENEDYSIMFNTANKDFQEWIKLRGYDAIIVPGSDKATGIEGRATVVFNSNQIKLTTNENPTLNEDIRYSLSEDKTLRPQEDYEKWARSVSKNNNELLNELLIKNYNFDYETPINSNDVRLYHGTEITNYDRLSLQEFNQSTMDRNYGNYFYLTNDKGFARIYGTYIAEFHIPKDKILYLIDYRNNYKGVAEEELFKKYWALEMPDNEYIIKNIEQVKEYTKNSVSKLLKLDNTQYSLSEDKQQDSQGRILTPEQQKHFKDSKARDKKGRLLVLYHGTDNNFTIFDVNKLGKFTGADDALLGFHFTTNKQQAKMFGKNTKAVYLDIKKPLDLSEYSNLENFANDLYYILSGKKFNNNNEDGMTPLDYLEEAFQSQSDLRELKDEIINTKGALNRIKKLGYDGMSFQIQGTDVLSMAQIGETSVLGTKEYIVFNSNQIKSVDNKQPTTNDDINLSQEDPTWKGYLEKNYKPQGTRTMLPTIKKQTVEDILPKPTITKEEKVADLQNTLKDAKDKNKILTIAKEGNKILGFFNKNERTRFKKVVSKYTTMTKEQLISPEVYNDLKRDLKIFAEREIGYKDEDLREAKNVVRKTKIKVSDYVKRNITDYGDFKKENFGKLRIANDGMNVDSVYQELSEQFPYYFDPEINNDIDRLYALSDFMNKDVVLMEKFYTDQETMDELVDKTYNMLIDKANIETITDDVLKIVKLTRKEKVREYRDEAKELTANIATWEDKKSGLAYEVNTMERNIRDIIKNKDEADMIIDTYFGNITKNNARIEKEITTYNERIKEMKLSEKESIAVQMLGELKYNPQTNLISKNVYGFIEDNKLDLTKIENSVETFRNIYDELIARINDTLKSQGYKEIPYRKGYFPHFIEDKPTSIIGKMAQSLGWKFNKEQLPTDIAGITEQFRPGKTWFRNAQQRTGKETDYNALKGFDNYIRGAMDIIHHTEDIQKLRALENEIRYQYSDKGIQEEIDKIQENKDLTADEQQEQIDLLYSKIANQMPNLVTHLRIYTDNLANKKAVGDRDMEYKIGRQTYNTLTNIHNRLSANMIALNIRSAMTNFIPITQMLSQVSIKNTLKSISSTTKSFYRADDINEQSIFLTNRTQKADRLYKTKVESANEKAGILFEVVDDITSNVVVRGKYYENLDKGMTHEKALENADEFARKLMGGRDKGSSPTIFNQKNPIIKLFTAFQLETANQFGYMFKDLPNDLRDEGLKRLLAAYMKMFFAAWLYNKLFNAVTGSKVAFSPIDIIEDTYSIATNNNLSASDKTKKIATEYAQQVPFLGSVLGGGRLPISAALPDVGILMRDVPTLYTDSNDSKKITAANNLLKEISKPFIYLVTPFGAGQIKKTIEGLSMFGKETPGSYSASGNMRYPVEKTPGNMVQAALFGQYANKNAQTYFDNSYSTMGQKQIKEYNDLKIPYNEYAQYRKDLSNQRTVEDKFNFISNLPYTEEQKNIMINNAVNRQENIDISTYKNYGSMEEFNYANSNPNEYKLIKQVTDFNSYNSYMGEIDNIKSKYESITQRKVAVINYVNGLQLNVGQKAIMIKMQYPSIDNYNNQIVQYINGQNISIQEKVDLLKSLGFKINNGRVSW